MQPNETHALIRICRLRFRSFSEAADGVLDALGDVVPGTVVLGRLDPEQGECRLIGATGPELGELDAGSTLPTDGEELDGTFLSSLGVSASAGIPLELSDGRLVGILAALSRERESYEEEHLAMLGIGARMLSFEWESVERRAEMRRLRGRLPGSPGVDPETTLPARDGFMELLDHEWQLAHRGTVESVLVAFEVATDPDPDANGLATGAPAIDRLAVKLAAETLAASARGTDRTGRIGESGLAVVLVGCRPDQANTFIDRFSAAIQRVGQGTGGQIRLSHGVVDLAEAPSPGEAVTIAEAAAGGQGSNDSAAAARIGPLGEGPA